MGTVHKKDRHDGQLRSSVGLELLVGNVMTREVISVHKYETILHVAKILSERCISGLPVVDKKGKLIGIITQADILAIVGVHRESTFKDLLKHLLGEALPERKMGDIVGDIMVSHPVTIRPEATVAEAARLMDEKSVRRLPVVDEKKMLVGIISRADMLKAVIRELT